MLTEEGQRGSSVVDRMFTVLETCATSHRALTLVDLIQLTGLPKTTLHRVCWKLVEHGMLERTGEGFSISTKLFAMGGMHPMIRRIRAASMPYLHTLAHVSACVTNLAVLADDRALIIEEVFGRQSAIRPTMTGAAMPLHATAIGKALLSGLDDQELDGWLRRTRLRAYTGTTTVRPNLLEQQLERIRHGDVATSREECVIGKTAIAAPVCVDGRVVAAIAIVGQNDQAVRQFDGAVLNAARGVGSSLSRRPVATPVAA